MDIVPEKGNRIFMDALPGFIHSGDDFNINNAGIIATETTISAFKGFDTTQVAEFIRARKAIQYASSIDQWVALMVDRNNGGYANAWILAAVVLLMFFNKKFYYNCLPNFIMKRHPVRIPKGLYISKTKLKCRCKITQTSFYTMP